ncbi:MAG: hypothetical protein ABI284_06735 [Nitrosospira sp.]
MNRIRTERLSLHPFHWSLPIMEKEIRKFVAAISTLGLLAACSGTNAIEAKKGDTSLSAQNIGSFVGHDGLVRQYQNRATKLLEIAAEHEKRLQYCEDNSYLYGRYGQDSRAHAIALVQKYTLAAEKATASAFHHTWYRSLRNAIILLRWRHLDLDCPKSLAVNVAGTV